MSSNIKDFTLDELKEEFKNIGEKSYRAEQVYEWIYKKKADSFDEMTNLSLDLREKLKENFHFGIFTVVRKLESVDGTKKYLFDINDDKGSLIESVLMQYHHGYTVCVSSEIGCPMGCKFCASTGIKFERGLTPGEIVEQIMAIEKDSRCYYFKYSIYGNWRTV
jgi:23S rRNA (adenine2503-C2)-methyltransferase